jgi:hypothetical protein
MANLDSRGNNTSTSQGGRLHSRTYASFWIRELPFSLVLLLTIGGVAYTTFSRQRIFIYWEILAPIIGLVCIWYGWPTAQESGGKLRLIGAQILHWIAFLLVMNMVFLASVQKSFNATSIGLAVFTLLALGTFTSGVQILSWQVCLLGVIMAFGIPAIAWVENSALLLLLVGAIVVGCAIAIWWHWRGRSRHTV